MKRVCMFLLMCLFIVAGNLYAQQNNNVFTYKVGKYEISLLAEGQGNGNPRILIGATPEMMEKAIPEGTFPNATNTFLIKTPDQIILVDAGYGRELFNNLQSLGVTPEQVDVVLITHMHGDHIGGMLRDGNIAFPNAKVHLATREYGHWNGVEGNAKNMIQAYEGQISLFLPEKAGEAKNQLYPGIYAITSYGHTPGHSCFLVESDGQKLLIWGDLTHAMAIQMPYPQVAVTYDSNPDDAIKSRKEILEYVSKNNIPIAGMHIAYPGIGSVKAEGAGYQFVPVN
ncbi:MBL fold metallo-hydrolase [Parabacteroides sp. OttesenSCG-928-G07]|nr:MBL fold metallo-hydrolase [Parabacteroides sp. OttesenSCG-928-G21]MDL2278320.1 MBL fold metallo-hydrolase [Parabacteroides sp. OttesenSCG-928-G07]